MTGFFDSSPLEKQLANLECNATAAVQITHHFLQRLIKDRKRGCIVYTSSVSGYMPSPFSCEYFTGRSPLRVLLSPIGMYAAAMYGATKAFLSQFAACLAVEVKSRGRYSACRQACSP